MQTINKNISFELFLKNIYISAFTFGGGYVVIPMMKKYFVDELRLITHKELLDMSAIAQSTPGAIAVNLAVLVGYEVNGIKGALISCVATIIPPIMILTLISYFYDQFRSSKIISSLLKGMEAGVVATIVDLVIDMSMMVVKEKNFINMLLIPVSFILSFIF